MYEFINWKISIGAYVCTGTCVSSSFVAFFATQQVLELRISTVEMIRVRSAIPRIDPEYQIGILVFE